MDGINRINKLSIGQKDAVLLEVVNYLKSREDMDEKYLNEEKTLKGMASYIRGEVMKFFCEKNNTNNPISFAQEVKYNGVNAKSLAVGMTKEKTFELAINYFEKSNEELGINPEENKKEIRNTDKKDEFGSIFDLSNIKSEQKKDEDEIEQISFFS